MNQVFRIGAFFFGFLLTLIIVVVCKTNTAYADGFYTMEGEVIYLDEKRDDVIIQMNDGSLWVLHEIEDWLVGDYCRCIISNMGTPEIHDDEIISIRYTGYFGMGEE